MPHLAELLSRSAGERPEHLAVKLDENELSYAALDDAAACAAALLRKLAPPLATASRKD